MSPTSTGLSVVVPAHNEGRGIGRLLTELTDAPPSLDVIVVCNGCTDDTADRAREFPVRVIEIDQPSKQLALEVGDSAARHAHRAYVDADVVISARAVGALLGALTSQVLVASPVRELELDRSARAVRWYYDFWRELPQVQEGSFGRGVIVMSPQAWRRVRDLPKVMSDDLAISEAFAPEERAVVPGAVVRIAAPRTMADLVRRRVRVATGNAQIDRLGMRASRSHTSLRTVVGIVARRPSLAPNAIVFLGVTVVARVLAGRQVRRGDFATWLRDESSRED